MKKIIRYEAVDGQIFDNKEECLRYEAMVIRVAEIMRQLNPAREDMDFFCGDGFIQQNPDVTKKVKAELFEATKDYLDKSFTDPFDGQNVNTSYMCRITIDIGVKPLRNAWSRLYCIDANHREWGQKFFAKGGI